MKYWKAFFPPRQELDKLLRIAPSELFINKNSKPIFESIYIRNKDGQWISLSWNYVDVEFKFEIYCLSIDSLDNIYLENLISIGPIPNFASIEFLVKSEWTRPTTPGEVPDNFEQIIEESGHISSIPSSAIAIGTTLCGIVFNDFDQKPLLAIVIDDTESYSVKKIVESEAIISIMAAYDSFSFPELMAWKPPILA